MNITNISLWKATLLGLCFLVILGLSSFLAVKYYRAYKSASQSLEQAQTNLRIYDAVVGEQRERNYETRLALVETQRKLSLSEEQVERLKAQDIRRVQAIGELELNISSYRDSLLVYRDVEVEYDIVDIEETVDGPMLPLPVSFGYQDDWLTQKATISEQGLGSISFEMDSVEVDISLGSRGVFNKVYLSSVSTNSPYLEFTKSSFQLVDNKPKAWPYILTGTIGLILGASIALF